MLIPLTIVFLVGLALGSYLPYLPLTILLLLILAAAATTVVERWTNLPLRSSLALYGAGLAGILAWTMAAMGGPQPHLVSIAGPDRVPIMGTIVEPVRHSGTRSVMVVSVEQVGAEGEARQVNGQVRVTWREADQDFSQGDRVTFRARLRAAVGTLNLGGFDYAAHLKRRGIDAVASVSGPGRIALVSSGGDRFRWAFWHRIDTWRDRIHRAASATLDGPALGIYLGMITGERGYISHELRDHFMATGTVHILSISGSHLGLIAFLSFFLVRQGCLALPAGWLLGLSRWMTASRLAALLTIPPVTFYALLAGAEVATTRALMMIMVFLLAVWLGREKQLLHALAVAALLILAHGPQALMDISFQLSFISVLAIALVLRWKQGLGQELPQADEPLWRKARRWLIDYAWLTAGVTLATLPLVAYYFNQVAWLGLWANLIVVPFAGFILVPLGLLSAFTLLIFGGNSLPLGQYNQSLYDLLADLVRWLSMIPGAEWHVASPAVPAIVLFYVVLIVACRPSTPRAWRGAALLVTLLCVAWWSWSPRQVPDGETLRVTFLDVGQGDASVVELPDGRTILIDGGAAYERLDMGRAVVGPYLWDRGIRHLDVVIGTHPQLDHVGGLSWVIQKFSVDQYWDNGLPRERAFYRRLERSLRARGLVERQAVEGQVVLSSKACQLTVLNPPRDQTRGRDPESGGSLLNNLSVVTRLDCGPHVFLFTADIEAEAMARLGRSGTPIRASVVKVPHHGARSSLSHAWVRRVAAQVAVVSAGRHNPYRHPAPTVLRSYADAGASLWRTDRDGAISIVAHTSSPALTIRSARQGRPHAVRPGLTGWQAEKKNLSRIWAQWIDA